MLQRCLTGVMLVVWVCLAVIYLPFWPFTLLMSTLLVWLSYELLAMLGLLASGRAWMWHVSCHAVFVLFAGSFLNATTTWPGRVILAVMALWVGCTLFLWRHVRQPWSVEVVRWPAVLIASVMWLGFAWSVLSIRAVHGVWGLLGIVGLVALVDTTAYMIGSQWGQRRLIPQLSPGKTWLGCVAGVCAGMLYSASWAWYRSLAWPEVMLVGLAGGGLACAAVYGDLVESTLKRVCGVKDSGRLLPGHGGILDRIDAMLIVFPLAYGLLFMWH